MIPNKPLQLQRILIFFILSSATANQTSRKNKAQNPQKHQKSTHVASYNENRYVPFKHLEDSYGERIGGKGGNSTIEAS